MSNFCIIGIFVVSFIMFPYNISKTIETKSVRKTIKIHESDFSLNVFDAKIKRFFWGEGGNDHFRILYSILVLDPGPKRSASRI